MHCKARMCHPDISVTWRSNPLKWAQVVCMTGSLENINDIQQGGNTPLFRIFFHCKDGLHGPQFHEALSNACLDNRGGVDAPPDGRSTLLGPWLVGDVS